MPVPVVAAPPTRRALRAGRRARRRVRQLAVAGTAIAATTLLSLLGTGTTYALWSDSRALDAGVLRSGTIGLTVGGTLSAAAFQNLLPGEVVAQQVTLHNSGSTDLSLEGWLSAVSTGFEARVKLGAATCGTTPLAGGGTPALQLAPAALGTLDAGASRSLCVEVTALAAAVPAQSAPFVITLHGTQED